MTWQNWCESSLGNKEKNLKFNLHKYFVRIKIMMTHTHMEFVIALAGKPGCYRFWEQLGLQGVCMSDQK